MLLGSSLSADGEQVTRLKIASRAPMSLRYSSVEKYRHTETHGGGEVKGKQANGVDSQY